MSERKIGFDEATLDAKILVDDDNFLVMPAIIASEIVHKYENGWAYKPADELEKSSWTADGRWVTILKHPDSAILQRASDIYGRVEEPKYVKDLMDPKTKRPCRKGIRANIKWFKDKTPENIIQKVKSGELHDVSIGFTYEEDRTPGEWNGQKYDYVQRDIFLDHVAAPIEAGRCPGPICGIAFDSVVKPKVAVDPFGEYKNFEDCVAKNQDKSDPEAYCATIKRKIEGEAAAKKEDCPICTEIEKVGLFESSKRLAVAYGKDNVLAVIKSVKPKKEPDIIRSAPIGSEPPKKQSIEDLLVESKKAMDSVRWLFE